MNCIRCGKEVPENEMLCEDCKRMDAEAEERGGSESERVETTGTMPVVVQEKQVTEFIGRLLNFLRIFFKVSVPHAVKLGAEDDTPYWAVLLPLNAVITGLVAFAVYDRLAGRYLGMGGKVFGAVFFMSLVVSVLLAVGIFVILKVCKKKGSVFCIANVVTVSAFALTLAYLVGAMLGLLLPSLGISVIISGFVSFFLLVYIGIQKIDRFDKSPFWAYILMVLIVLFIIMFCGQTYIESAVEAVVNDMIGSLGAMLF